MSRHGMVSHSTHEMVVHDVLDDEASCIWHALPYGDVQDVTSSLHHGCDRPTGRGPTRTLYHHHPGATQLWWWGKMEMAHGAVWSQSLI